MPVEVPCAGAVVLRTGADGVRRLLLARRGHAPSEGLWSLPGGRVEPGESFEAAALRELAEETALVGRVVREAGVSRLPAGDDRVYVIRDFLVEVTDSDGLLAGDDAAEVAWFAATELDSLPMTAGLLDVLRDWGVLP